MTLENTCLPGRAHRNSVMPSCGHRIRMKISVITASYNSEATIGCTIESFLAQKHSEKEMLVIDGLSSDAHTENCRVIRFRRDTRRLRERQGRLRRHEQGLSPVSGRRTRIPEFRRYISRSRCTWRHRRGDAGLRHRVRRPQHGDGPPHQAPGPFMAGRNVPPLFVSAWLGASPSDLLHAQGSRPKRSANTI